MVFDRRSLGLDDEGRRARMQRIAHAIVAEWSGEARGELKSTLPAYLKAIGIREVTENTCVVELPGDATPSRVAMLARMIEFGLGPGGIGTEGPFDIRTFLLKGRKSVNVPFSFTSALIKQFGGAGAVKAASKLSPTTTGADGRTIWGGRLEAGLAQKIKPHHVADPLQDMVRKVSTFSRKPNGKAVVQTTDFRTWRKASWSNKDPAAWRHPGIKAHHLADRVAERMGDIIFEVL